MHRLTTKNGRGRKKAEREQISEGELIDRERVDAPLLALLFLFLFLLRMEIERVLLDTLLCLHFCLGRGRIGARVEELESSKNAYLATRLDASLLLSPSHSSFPSQVTPNPKLRMHEMSPNETKKRRDPMQKVREGTKSERDRRER